MPAHRTGTIRFRSNRWEARVYIAAEKKQIVVKLPHASSEDEARERARVLSDVAAKIEAANQGAFLRECLSAIGEARDEKILARELGVIDRLCSGGAVVIASSASTFQDVAERWTSGEMSREFPDHVPIKRTWSTDVYRLNAHVYALVGKVPVSEFRLEHAEAVMRALPSDLTGTRRQVAQLIHRVMRLSVYPLKLRESNPIPTGWLPMPSGDKALTFLYPDEDARLLSCVSTAQEGPQKRGRPSVASRGIPLGYRVLYGFLAREGCRVGDAIGEVVQGGGRTPGLEWSDVDLERGAIKLDENKTDEPRWWALNEGVLRALRIWRRMRLNERFVFDVGISLPDDHMAERFRSHIRAAAIERVELFERTMSRQPIRVHDLRATFITVHLAHGKTEAWISARTGHTTSDMINRYRRAARTVEELSLPMLMPLDEAIPEFRGGSTM